jgi:hypothetical protein
MITLISIYETQSSFTAALAVNRREGINKKVDPMKMDKEYS